MHKVTWCYKEKACDKCVIHADRKFCFIEANQTVFDNLLRCQLQHLFRLAVAVYRFTCFCRAILPITEPSDKLFALSNIIDFLLTLSSIVRIMILEPEFLSWLGNWYFSIPEALNLADLNIYPIIFFDDLLGKHVL